MREGPILFRGSMVRRLPGIETDPAKWKTQTRRVLRPQPHDALDATKPGMWWPRGKYNVNLRLRRGIEKASPFGYTGDRLWVREAWGLGWIEGWAVDPALNYRADNYQRLADPKQVATLADPSRRGWRPSIHMPRWASRITLEVTHVRVERLQEISDADIAAEGVSVESVQALWDATPRRRQQQQTWRGTPPRIDCFAPSALWHLGWALINGERSYAANPWVWVVEFKRVAEELERRAG